MDNVLQQLGIDCKFSTPYHQQINGKLEVFYKYLKTTLNKLCEKDPDNCDKYINQVLASYHVTPYLATAESTIFLVYGRDPNLSLHQLLEPMQQVLSDPISGCLELKSHCLALVIAKKTLDENQFKHAQKMTNCTNPISKLETEYSLKNKEPGKWDLKWWAGYRTVCIKCNRHQLHIENKATGKTKPCNVKDVVPEPPVKLSNVDTMFGRAEKFINHPANLPTITLTTT